MRVHLEPGVESYVNMDGKSYLQKNSELGLVFILSERPVCTYTPFLHYAEVSSLYALYL